MKGHAPDRPGHDPAGEGGRLLRFGIWAALVLLPLLFYAGMIFGGKEPPAPDTLAVRPLGVWAKAAEHELGATPQWIPHLFSGMPSYASYVYTPASPLSPLDYLLRLFTGSRGARYYLCLLLGAIAGYLFFRRQGASRPAAAAASLGFVMTPYIPGVVEAGHSTKLRALMHVPVFLLAVDWLLRRPGAWSAAALALATAMLGWSNHPQILYYAAMVAVLYGLGKLWSNHGTPHAVRIPRALLWTAVGGVVAAGLLAEPTLAVREYAPYSIRGSGEGGGMTWEAATAWSFHPLETVSFLFPEFYGLKGPTYFGLLPFTQSTHYFGIVLLACAIAGAFLWRGRERWVWLGMSVILLLIGFGEHAPILYKPLFELLPYFNKFRVPSMIYALLPLTLGALAAHGIDALVASPRSHGKATRPPAADRRWWVAAGLAAAVAILIGVLGMATKSSGMEGPGWIRPVEAQRLAADQLEALRSARWDLRQTSLVRAFFLLAALLAMIPLGRRLRAPASAALLGALLVGDAVMIGTRFLDLTDRATLEASLRPTAETEFLGRQRGPFRILPIDEFSSNRFAAFGINSIGGYQPAKLRIYQDLIDGNLIMHDPVLRMLNARYLLSETDPGHPSFRKVADGVYEFTDAEPRAWFVPAWQSLPDEEAVLRALGGASFDPAAVALFSRPAPTGIPSTGLPVRTVEEVEVGPQRVSIEVGEGAEAGLLIVSEIYYPAAWRATIDGQPAAILPANHCLRALVVPPGRHGVEMTYVSPAYATGRLLNRAGGVALLVLAAAGFVLERRGRPREVR
jgi:hypothetical protein